MTEQEYMDVSNLALMRGVRAALHWVNMDEELRGRVVCMRNDIREIIEILATRITEKGGEG